MPRERIDTHLGFVDRAFFRQEYEGLGLRKPGHALLPDVTVEEDAIYANQGFFDRYGEDRGDAVRIYLVELARATGTWTEIKL